MNESKFLHVLNLTDKRNRKSVKTLIANAMTPKQAINKMIYSFYRYKAYQYSCYGIESDKAKNIINKLNL